MGILEKLFHFGRKDGASNAPGQSLPRLHFGRYSDNNKTLAKTNRWYEAEDLFKQKKYTESLIAFFDYLRDEEEDNVRVTRDGDLFQFTIYQGTRTLRGMINETECTAQVDLARMEKPAIPVMRRLLEMNYGLYYSRFALQQDVLCMLFDAPRESCSPNKLYYGFKELATRADKQDDLLLTDFPALRALDDTPVEAFSDTAAQVKLKYFRRWIEQTLKRIDELNVDSFSGGIAYMLLSLIYRIDYLITPEGKLLNEIEEINNLYWANKEEKTAVERNQLLRDGLNKLLAWSDEEILKSFYRGRSTFSITLPKPQSALAESIRGANENMYWYRDNKYPDIALQVMEYGFAYAQFSYSLPKPASDLFLIFMQVNYPDFFAALGIKTDFLIGGKVNPQLLSLRIFEIIRPFADKYPNLQLDAGKLNYQDQVEFCLSFLNEVASLNFDSKPAA